MTRNHRRLLDAAQLIVTCWDRSVSAVDLHQQIGAHVEDMRILVHEDLRKSTARRKRRTTTTSIQTTAKELFAAGSKLVDEQRRKG